MGTYIKVQISAIRHQDSGDDSLGDSQIKSLSIKVKDLRYKNRSNPGESF